MNRKRREDGPKNGPSPRRCAPRYGWEEIFLVTTRASRWCVSLARTDGVARLRSSPPQNRFAILISGRRRLRRRFSPSNPQGEGRDCAKHLRQRKNRLAKSLCLELPPPGSQVLADLPTTRWRWIAASRGPRNDGGSATTRSSRRGVSLSRAAGAAWLEMRSHASRLRFAEHLSMTAGSASMARQAIAMALEIRVRRGSPRQ